MVARRHGLPPLPLAGEGWGEGGCAPRASLTRATLPLLLAATLAACSAGPDYHRPDVPIPPAWAIEAPFRAGAPGDAEAKGPWWRRFADPTLDALEQRALDASPNLTAAVARLEQARASLRAAGAVGFPQLGVTTRDQRLRISADRPLTNYAVQNLSTTQNDFLLNFTASYELDLAGRVRRTVEGAVATTEQIAADLENVRLLLTSDLAANYFNLRSLDIELDVVQRSIGLQRRALDFIATRHDLGAASGLELAQQQALVDQTLTQVDVLRRQRAQYEHAIATLTGTPAPVFALAVDARELTPPEVPIGVPSDVLERRPDVASAERTMAATNAQIGVAKAAYFPSVLLNANLGGESNALASLVNASSLLWAVGVSATQTLFDGGRIGANVEIARAGYEIAAANYRRVVLTAMQEVEDGITGLAALERAFGQSRLALADSRRVFEMATARYEGGAATYLDVITAQQLLLANERQSAQLMGQRLVTAVALVKALGGDWRREGRGAGE